MRKMFLTFASVGMALLVSAPAFAWERPGDWTRLGKDAECIPSGNWCYKSVNPNDLQPSIGDRIYINDPIDGRWIWTIIDITRADDTDIVTFDNGQGQTVATQEEAPQVAR